MNATPAAPGTEPSIGVHLRQAVTTLPAYVPGARPSGDGVAKLSSNEMPFPVQNSVLAALTQAAADASRYPEMTAATLAARIATRHGLDPQQVVVGNGSVALIQHLLDTVCDEGDEVVLPWRSFEAYPICVAVAGAHAIKVPLTAQARHDVPAMLAAITPNTRVIMACSPNNPTGPALTGAELRALLEGVPGDVVVLLDEAYLDFVTDPQVEDGLTHLAAYPNLVIARTFSKAHALAGMRVGYLICAPTLASAIRSVATPFGVNLPAQAAAIAAFEPESLAETGRRVDVVVSERERVVAAAREAGWEVPDAQGNFFWLPVGEQATVLAKQFVAAGILARPFAGEGLRISIGAAAENDRVLALLRKLGSAGQ
ncbi:Putative phenylalanine aminotransferase [Actinomyces bovis]|uniref:Histidinol-phosphate aminotransferase n=1 Tax=Actinomyces bovis TaxID=1658 RepID=A0ABY1VQP1_9ACTO|nr:histidinol-phosphate transaminase [Actinomyces bovis]SPT54451.1 Putative phenylalanine aminotransferase [Actinomyces bovis]VEG55936.1 Putative phenylalanine aminotransferase [Actinomyces israelii]